MWSTAFSLFTPSAPPIKGMILDKDLSKENPKGGDAQVWGPGSHYQTEFHNNSPGFLE